MNNDTRHYTDKLNDLNSKKELLFLTLNCLRVAYPTILDEKSFKKPARPYGCPPLYQVLARRPTASLFIDQDQKSSIVVIFL